MRPFRVTDALRTAAAGALLAVPLLPYIAVGEQRYAAVGFLQRIDALVAMPLIDGSWRVPPLLALVTSVSALVVIVLPRAHRTTGLVITAALSLSSALMAYRLTAQSAILHPLMGPRLLVIGGVLSLGALALDKKAPRSAGTSIESGSQMDFHRRQVDAVEQVRQ